MEEKIPRSGFILIVPGSPEGERLRLCWDKNQDRPDRFFVPFTYVDACNAAGTFLKQIFIENGEPIKFHIDSSIANINTRATLSLQIAVCIYDADYYGRTVFDLCLLALGWGPKRFTAKRTRNTRRSTNGNLPTSSQDQPGRSR